jgi:hypothetical protein
MIRIEAYKHAYENKVMMEERAVEWLEEAFG